jgi:tRNA G18 (ribose-2'-O)-methylase SpoU
VKVNFIDSFARKPAASNKLKAMEFSPLEPHRAGIPFEALPALQRSSLRLVLDQVRSAHNTGALFRTADAAAVELIYLLGLTPHPPHGQVEKTALGATGYVPWVHRESEEDVLQELEADGYSLIALDNGPDSVCLWNFQWPLKAALVAGNEVEGVSSSLLSRCRHKINLPMFGYKRSLNVTTALGIAIYDYLRAHHSRH